MSSIEDDDFKDFMNEIEQIDSNKSILNSNENNLKNDQFSEEYFESKIISFNNEINLENIEDDNSEQIISKEKSLTPPPSPTGTFFHFSKEHGKYLKNTPYGMMEWIQSAKIWIPFNFPENEEVLEEYQNKSYNHNFWQENRDEIDSKSNENNIKKRKKENLSHFPQKRKKKESNSIIISGFSKTIDLNELANIFSKCGIILKDINQNPTVIQHQDGSVLISFLRNESVSLAITLYDDTEIFSDKIKVRQASLDEIEAFIAKPIDKQTFKLLMKERKRQLNQLKWSLNDTSVPTGVQFKTIILRHVFTQEEVSHFPNIKLEIQTSIQKILDSMFKLKYAYDEQYRRCVSKIKIYLNHPEGIVAVQFRQGKDAEYAVNQLNNSSITITNIPNQRTIEAELWKRRSKDLKEEFEIMDNEDDLQRLDKFIDSLS